MSLIILDDMIVDESDSHENKRVKITTACDTCRRRKVKCDGASPCANCTRGAYQCTFSDASTKRPRGPPKGFVALIEDRLHTIESLLVNLVNKDNINENNREIKRERESTIEDSNQRQRYSTFKIRQYSPTNVATPVTQSSSSHYFIPTTPPADANYSSDQSPGLIPGFNDDLGSDDEEILLHNLVSPNSSNSLQSSTLSFLMLNNNNNQQHDGSYVDPPISSSIPQLSNPPSDISRQLLEKYFNHFHPYFPIINRGQLFKMMSSNNVEDQPSPLLLNAIYAIGAMYPPVLQDTNSSLIFYDRARSLLDYFTDVPRLSTVQALILLCMIDQGKPSSYRPQTYSSMAIRMAQSMGLNRRNGAVYRGKGRQTKKLIWWGCFIFDRLNSLTNGDPLTINDRICDIEFPSLDEVDDQDDDNNHQSQSTQQKNSQQSNSTTTNYSSTYAQQINIFINFIKLSKIIGQIMEHLQSTSCIGMTASWNHHAMVNSFENSLLNWLKELPPFLQYTPSPQHMPLPGQIASLHMHYQTLILTLHYPYIASHHSLRSPNMRMSKTYIKSLNICSGAAHVITHIGLEALNNVHTCITFPIMFHSLGKAAKVHTINLTSPQRGLALIALKNIIKTIKICRFYEQNNIMAELANQMISVLENVLMTNQERFSNEETIEISNVPPPPSASSHIKISPTMSSNQVYHSDISSSSKTIQTIDPKRESNSTSSSNNIPQHTTGFAYIQQNQNGEMQQYTIFDPFGMQIHPPSMMIGNEISSNETQYWDNDIFGGVGGFNNNIPYNGMNNMTSNISLPTTASSTSTPTLSSTSAAEYFPQHHQPSPRRQSSLPVSSPISIFPTATTTTKTHSRSNNMSLDTIEQDDSGPTIMNETLRNDGLQNIHPSRRYVFMDTNDNNSPIVYEGYDHLPTSSETHQRIFNKIPRRVRKKEDEPENGQIIATGSDHRSYLSNKDALIVLSRRSNGRCGIIPKFGGGIENGTPSIGNGFEENNDFNHFDGNVNNNGNSVEMKEVHVGFNI